MHNQQCHSEDTLTRSPLLSSPPSSPFLLSPFLSFSLLLDQLVQLLPNQVFQQLLKKLWDWFSSICFQNICKSPHERLLTVRGQTDSLISQWDKGPRKQAPETWSGWTMSHHSAPRLFPKEKARHPQHWLCSAFLSSQIVSTFTFVEKLFWPPGVRQTEMLSLWQGSRTMGIGYLCWAVCVPKCESIFPEDQDFLILCCGQGYYWNPCSVEDLSLT